MLLISIERALESGATYNDLSVGWLVGEAKISRSTFYTYFQDKGDLLRALTEHVISDMIEAGQDWWALPRDASKDDLRGTIQKVCDSYRRYGALWGAVVQSAAYDPLVRDQYDQTIKRAISEIAAHIRSGQENGSVHRDIDADDTAAWITWMGERGLHQLVEPADEARAKELAVALTDIVWKLLYEETR